MRRHLEGAHFDQTQPSCRAVRRVELVDTEFGSMRVAGDVYQEIAKDSIDQPGRAFALVCVIQNIESQLQLIDGIRTSLVDTWRLTRWADEHSGKKI